MASALTAVPTHAASAVPPPLQLSGATGSSQQ
jgi:hypothetical protein